MKQTGALKAATHLFCFISFIGIYYPLTDIVIIHIFYINESNPYTPLIDIVFIHFSYIYIERERSSASGVPLESPFNFILINIFEIFLWYSIRMKLIIYEIRAKTMSVTGGVLESLRQVKKQCFFHFTLWLDHSDIIVFLHIYTTNIWHFRIYV